MTLNDQPIDSLNSDPIDLAEIELEKGNWSNAFRLLNSADLIANPRAQNVLAWLYLAGNGTTKDPLRTITCLQKAVDKEYWPAMCNLARAYQCGIGIKEDRQAAFKLYKQVEKKPRNRNCRRQKQR